MIMNWGAIWRSMRRFVLKVARPQKDFQKGDLYFETISFLSKIGSLSCIRDNYDRVGDSIAKKK
jgi:hypothetical protein